MDNLYIRYKRWSNYLRGYIKLSKDQPRLISKEQIQQFPDIDTFCKFPSIGNVYLKIHRDTKEIEEIIRLDILLYKRYLLLGLDDDCGLNWKAVCTDEKSGPFYLLTIGKNTFHDFLIQIDHIISYKHVNLTHDIYIFLSDEGFFRAIYVRYLNNQNKFKRLLIRKEW